MKLTNQTGMNSRKKKPCGAGRYKLKKKTKMMKEKKKKRVDSYSEESNEVFRRLRQSSNGYLLYVSVSL